MMYATNILQRVTNGSIHIFYDNESAIYLSTNNKLCIPIKTKHKDILRVIIHAQAQIIINIHFKISMITMKNTHHIKN